MDSLVFDMPELHVHLFRASVRKKQNLRLGRCEPIVLVQDHAAHLEPLDVRMSVKRLFVHHRELLFTVVWHDALEIHIHEELVLVMQSMTLPNGIPRP